MMRNFSLIRESHDRLGVSKHRIKKINWLSTRNSDASSPVSRSQILDYSASLNSEFMNEIVNVLGEETDDRRTDSGQA